MRPQFLPTGLVVVTAWAAASFTHSAEQAIAVDQLVYSNTLGDFATAPGAGTTIADDIIITGAENCHLAGFEFDVTGNADGKGGGSYAVDFELYDDCPGSGGLPIRGTKGRVSMPNAGKYTIAFQVPSNVQVPIPRTIWLAVTFDRDHAGWVGGAPALVGYSDDWFYDPFIGCAISHGGYPAAPHASMNARAYMRGSCPQVHAGYHASTPRRGPFNPGAELRMADDITLEGTCQMVGYEVTVRGSGMYDMDLRAVGAGGMPGQMIAGTHSALEHFGFVRTLQVDFDPPIPLPSQLWFTVAMSSSVARTMVAGRPVRIGQSGPGFALLNGPAWQMQTFPPDIGDGAFQVTILCAGPASIGACCDMRFPGPDGGAQCREVPRANCPYPAPGSNLLPAWREGQACNPDPFEAPCGTAACCLANGTCSNLTQKDCAPRGSSWTLGSYCNTPGIQCPNMCLLSNEPCTLPHATPGCIDPFCCAEICSTSAGAFCCQVNWDTACAGLAAAHCDLAPTNDECFGSGQEGARLVSVGSTVDADTNHATESESDPGFCCHGQDPGRGGLGTVWFRFVATATSARIRTCASNTPATDSLIQVFAVADSSTSEKACASLRSIGCSDDAAGCSASSQNSSVCVRNLTVGQTYYVLVGAKTEESRGVYRLNIGGSCSDPAPPVCACPTGLVEWIDPPKDVLDARRPHLPTNASVREGISQFLVQAPMGSGRRECWTLCETVAQPVPNSVQNAQYAGNGQYILSLARPITPEAATTLTLGGDPQTRGVFYFHPGNVQDDSATSPSDLLELIDALNGIRFLAWGKVSGDIDRSGTISPADILEAIDLLNGANAFEAWNGVQRPDPSPCME